MNFSDILRSLCTLTYKQLFSFVDVAFRLRHKILTLVRLQCFSGWPVTDTPPWHIEGREVLDTVVLLSSHSIPNGTYSSPIKIYKDLVYLRSWDSLLLSLWRAFYTDSAACSLGLQGCTFYVSSSQIIFFTSFSSCLLLLLMVGCLGTGIIVIFALMHFNLLVKFLTSLPVSLLEDSPVIHYNSSC